MIKVSIDTILEGVKLAEETNARIERCLHGYENYSK